MFFLVAKINILVRRNKKMINEIYCSLDPKCKDPVGPARENTTVTFSIRLDKISVVESPKLVIFRIDKWDQRQEVDLEFSKASFNNNYYSCSFTPKVPDVYYYYFTLFINGKYVEIRKDRFSKSCFGGKENECFQLTVFTKDISVPDFMKGATFYQIFPDRFYNSGEAKENVPTDRKIHTDWYENPDYLPNDKGIILNNDYFGGDLKGITQKLDYIESLGVTIIYLNPIFEAHSNHRYNTADYMKIDPLLGKEEDFVELCSEARKRGIRIILDGVFNHTGSDSIYFNKERRYATVGAYTSKDSPYYNWYCFFNYPNGYDSWWGFDTLPKLNKSVEECIDFFCTVVKKWIRLGASGFRLDVVDEITNYMLYRLTKAIKEEVVFDSQPSVTGEVWEDVSIKEAYGERKHYFTENTLDSAMNYVYKDALFYFFENKNAEALLDTIVRTIENYPKDNLDAMMNMISGHDIERAITRLAKGAAGGHDRYWQAMNDYLDPESYERGKRLFKQMAVIQYFLPGNPCLYYGDEAGLYGFKDPHNRKTYPWGREDKELVEFFQLLGKIRRDNVFLKDGRFIPLIFHGGLCTFVRESLSKDERLYVGVNLTDKPFDMSFVDSSKVLYTSEPQKVKKLVPNGSIILK